MANIVNRNQRKLPRISASWAGTSRINLRLPGQVMTLTYILAGVRSNFNRIEAERVWTFWQMEQVECVDGMQVCEVYITFYRVGWFSVCWVSKADLRWYGPWRHRNPFLYQMKLGQMPLLYALIIMYPLSSIWNADCMSFFYLFIKKKMFIEQVFDECTEKSVFQCSPDCVHHNKWLQTPKLMLLPLIPSVIWCEFFCKEMKESKEFKELELF